MYNDRISKKPILYVNLKLEHQVNGDLITVIKLKLKAYAVRRGNIKVDTGDHKHLDYSCSFEQEFKLATLYS